VITVLIPIFNDWEAASRLLRELDDALDASRHEARILLVDDGSSETASADLVAPAPSRLRGVEILHLRRNVGHQRAIAIGLSHIESGPSCEAVVVMDGDGEDRPEDVPRLLDELQRAGAGRIVFAERLRRSEGPWFVMMYAFYRWIHALLTGERVRFGNFSAIPAALLGRLVAMSDLWNHYAAAVVKSRVPFTSVATERGRRYAGAAKMNYVALITHGLSAMSVFGDWIGVRLLAATIGASALAVAGMIGALIVGWARGSWPEWLPVAFGILVILLGQAFAVSLAFAFLILSGRDSSTFIPLRDYRYFVAGIERVHPRSHEAVPLRR